MPGEGGSPQSLLLTHKRRTFLRETAADWSTCNSSVKIKAQVVGSEWGMGSGRAIVSGDGGERVEGDDHWGWEMR